MEEWIHLEDYREEWKQAWGQEKKRLRAALRLAVKDIQHVGSTAIPGLCARPEVDILVILKTGRRKEAAEQLTRTLGYRKETEAGREEFGKTLTVLRGGEEGNICLLLAEEGKDTEAADILAVRDYLMTHPDVMQVYRNLKWELAAEYPEDPEGYEAGKAAFLEGLLSDALAWSRTTGKLSSHMSFGMLLGVVPGGILGAALGNFPMGAVLGLMLGMVIGVTADQRKMGGNGK